MKNRRQTLTLFAGTFAGAFTAVAILFAASSVMARGSGPDESYATDGRVFPYRGYLELDGAAINETVTFDVTLRTPAGSTYTEEHVDVPVYGGEFQILVGGGTSRSQATLPFWVFQRDGVTIELAVNDTPMSNPQEIQPVPYAYWAAEGQDFFVEGTLGVGVDATDATITTANSTGTGAFDLESDYSLLLYTGPTPQQSYGLGIQAATLGFNSRRDYDFYVGDTAGARDASRAAFDIDGYSARIGGSDLVLGINDGRSVGSRALQRALVHYTSDSLVMNFGGDFEGGVDIQSSTRIGGAATVDGTATINGNTTITGSDNNGTVSALAVVAGSQTLRLDGNEIDSMGGDGILYINNNSAGDIYLQNNSRVDGTLRCRSVEPILAAPQTSTGRSPQTR